MESYDGHVDVGSCGSRDEQLPISRCLSYSVLSIKNYLYQDAYHMAVCIVF